MSRVVACGVIVECRTLGTLEAGRNGSLGRLLKVRGTWPYILCISPHGLGFNFCLSELLQRNIPFWKKHPSIEIEAHTLLPDIAYTQPAYTLHKYTRLPRAH